MNVPSPTADTAPEADPAPTSAPEKVDPVLKLRDAMRDALRLLDGYAEERDPGRKKTWRDGSVLLFREIRDSVGVVLAEYESDFERWHSELLRRVNEEGDRRLAAMK
jgi:hypothetical protein